MLQQRDCVVIDGGSRRSGGVTLTRLFPFEIAAEDQSAFSTLFPLQLNLFHLSKLCVIFYLDIFDSLILLVDT